jgi:hypothetical protein
MLGLFIQHAAGAGESARAGAGGVEWLRELQAEQVELRQYEYSPLVRCRAGVRWSGRSLFESLLVFENYRWITSLREQAGV